MVRTPTNRKLLEVEIEKTLKNDVIYLKNTKVTHHQIVSDNLSIYNLFHIFYLPCQTLIIRFEMKKLSEMNEEYLGVESDDSEQELVNAQEEQEDTADNQLSDQRMQHQRTPGSITVSRILKSNLACKGSF